MRALKSLLIARGGGIDCLFPRSKLRTVDVEHEIFPLGMIGGADLRSGASPGAKIYLLNFKATKGLY